MNKLSWLVFGAGAIGTYIGGSLALSGQCVTFLERPEVAHQIASRGIRLTLKGVDHLINEPLIATTVEEAITKGPFDIVIFALKSYDTLPALERIVPYSEAFPPFLCVQNGVDNENSLEKILGPGKVIAATVTSAVGRRAPGDIILERLRGMGIFQGHPLSRQLAQILNAAGLNAVLFNSPSAMKWSKLLTNLVANATSAILDMTPTEIFAHPGLYGIEIAQLKETLAVMHAKAIPVVDLPSTPVRALALATQMPTWLARPLLKRSVGHGRGGKMPSFHIDLHSGNPRSEVDYLNGAVARSGELAGIPTPVNQSLTEILLRLSAGQIPLTHYARKPSLLLNELATR